MKELELVKRYIVDTITTWDDRVEMTDYQKGIMDTGLDILDIIKAIEDGKYDDMDVNSEEFDW